jgi:hypothetical protein
MAAGWAMPGFVQIANRFHDNFYGYNISFPDRVLTVYFYAKVVILNIVDPIHQFFNLKLRNCLNFSENLYYRLCQLILSNFFMLFLAYFFLLI